VRMQLAYAYLRAGRRTEAVRAVLSSLIDYPRLRTVRDILSVARGFS
jgi:hypothetical protein